MQRFLIALIFASTASWVQAPRASACGSFFCGQTPVDQSAERIVFAVDEDSVTMIAQIAYMGSSEDFAWVLPLSEVPDIESLGTFSQSAMTQLDANTAPEFWGGCQVQYELASADGGAGDPSAPPADGGVQVHIRAEVGPYDVAVVESEDPQQLLEWLRQNRYRIGAAMEPYIEAYTLEGMKFLALRLQDDQDTSDIQPFMFTVPGNTPSVPLRMTAIAAEPEMGILVMIVGQERFGPANWPVVTIDDADLVLDDRTYPVRSNWTSLVAKGVDEAGGQGFVTELASTSLDLLERAKNSPAGDPETQAAIDDLVGLLEGRPYITRLYTRLSAEEMHSDPVFKRDAGGDVSNFHEIPYDDTMCQLPPDPCEFTTCGVGGLCRVSVEGDVPEAEEVGCACVPGATARTTFAPDGSATVICQDMRMSFLNPGDKNADGTDALPDTCAGYDCGTNGQCVAMNLTPTCVCDQGYVAVGDIDDSGVRSTRCVAPLQEVPAEHYQRLLPALPAGFAGGRGVPDAMPEPSDLLDVPVADPREDEPPVPGTTDDDTGSGDSTVGLCSIGARPVPGFGALVAFAAVALVRRRRTRC